MKGTETLEKLDVESIEEIEVKTEHLAQVLGVSGARVRQLKAEAVLTATARGWYPLASSVRAYLEFVDVRQSDEVKTERALLLRAQRANLELRTASARADHSTQKYQTATARAVVAAHFMGHRLIPTWLHSELQPLLESNEARRVAATVAGWQIAIRAELDRALVGAVERLNREGKMITTERDLAVAIDPGSGLIEHYADHPEDIQASEQAMLATIEALDDEHYAFDPPATEAER